MTRYLRQLKARAIRFRKAARPVVLLGLRRGGTTMVAEAMAAQKGVWYANEPFAVFDGRPGLETRRRMLPAAMHSQFFSLGETGTAAFDRYTRMLLDAALPEIGTAWRTLPILRAERVVLKVLNAPWMGRHLAGTTDAHLLVLLRHPGAQANSVLRQGWGFALEAYLARPDAMARYFSVEQIEHAMRVWEDGDRWSVAVLDWIVTSAGLRALSGPEVVHVTYEDVVSDPKGFAERILRDRFGFADATAMAAALGKPSGSSMMSLHEIREIIAARDVRRMTEGWREKTPRGRLEQGQALLDRFDVSGYRFT